MILFDVTKMAGAEARSGLTRVSARLRQELGAAARAVAWDARAGRLRDAGTREPVEPGADDWFLTVELFSEAERPGFGAFLDGRKCRAAAVFHDAIPLRWPHFTWPHSVQRHPEYIKRLAGFDRVWAVSAASRADLTGFWRWQGAVPRGPVGTIALGADFDGSARAPAGAAGAPAQARRPSLLCVGIIEPRKNQSFLLEVARELWAGGLDFDLHFVGRVNPHFGSPIARALARASRAEPRLQVHDAAADRTLRGLYDGATAVLFPTLAEGSGLPLVEALWRGVPCIASDLPVLRETADGGGCLLAAPGGQAAWAAAIRTVLADRDCADRLRREAVTRPLPRWAEAASAIGADLARA